MIHPAPFSRSLEPPATPATVPAPFPGDGGRRGWLPVAGLPAKHDLDYVKTGIELLLLLLAIPWLLKRIIRNPKNTSRAAADHHLK